MSAVLLGEVVLGILGLGDIAVAQPGSKVDFAPGSVTVPFALDQGRIVVDVTLALGDGSTERVRGWVDNGSSDFYVNRRVAALLGVGLSCDGQFCRGSFKVGGPEVAIGGMTISLGGVKEVKVPVLASAIAPGMSAEINIPTTILRNYDVVVNFPDRELTLSTPGRVNFKGVKSKMAVRSKDGLIGIPSKIENKNYELGLDLGSSVNFLSEELFEKISGAHPAWPRMLGAVGPFNTGEYGDEAKWQLMRVERLQFGPLFLSDVAVTGFHQNLLKNRIGQTESGFAGVLSSEALLNYRVGLDYAHSEIYFDIGRTVRFPDFDVVGLILRPEGDTGFSIIGIADLDGKPSVPGVEAGDRLVAIDETPVGDFTLGQVWSLLQGAPGAERRLTVSRAGKQVNVRATVQHFLGDVVGDESGKSKKK
jgi:hypothetical protein